MTSLDIIIKEDSMTGYLYLDSPEWIEDLLKKVKLSYIGDFFYIINNIKHVINYRDYDKINYIFQDGGVVPLETWIWLYEEDYLKNKFILGTQKD